MSPVGFLVESVCDESSIQLVAINKLYAGLDHANVKKENDRGTDMDAQIKGQVGRQTING